jgi:N6-adenosine-specific RNA methylase IME4
MGHYSSVRHEKLYVCTRGSCQPDVKQLFDSVQSIERSDKHSAKPVEFYDIIETLYTHGRKLEMFARVAREGWDVYGHQAELSEAG